MSCSAAREILDAAFDGRDQGERLLEADRHADDCAACATYRRELRAYAALMGDLPEVEVPAGLEARLLGAVERNRPRGRKRLRSPLLPITFVAILAFGVVAGTQVAAAQARDEARIAREAQEHKETITRRITRDRATFAVDPLSGTPVVALTGYARN